MAVTRNGLMFRAPMLGIPNTMPQRIGPLTTLSVSKQTPDGMNGLLPWNCAKAYDRTLNERMYCTLVPRRGSNLIFCNVMFIIEGFLTSNTSATLTFSHS